MNMRLTLCIAACAGLTACAVAPPASAPIGDWHAVPLPGKEDTHYSSVVKDGRQAIKASSVGSASMLRRHVQRAGHALGHVSFSWRVDDLVEHGNVAVASREDSPARILFAFQGDVATLPVRTRALFDLAEAVTGERPPFATLMYVWDASAPVGSVIINPRSDRIRKIVIDSGPQNLRRWREHRRDLVADYKLAFGENPGALSAIALMTDSDNTASRALSWYGPVELH